MTELSIKLYTLVCSINARIEGMKSKNAEFANQGFDPRYTDQDFFEVSEELESIAFENDEDLSNRLNKV